MKTEVATHIEIRKNGAEQDRAYVAGTRTRVQDIYGLAEIHGLSPDQIVEQLPHLTLGQVHAALAYYFDHRDAIQSELREDEQFVEMMRRQTGPGPLEQRLSAARGDDAVSS
jgi:uncharacterized protein (DUF433 family)